MAELSHRRHPIQISNSSDSLHHKSLNVKHLAAIQQSERRLEQHSPRRHVPLTHLRRQCSLSRQQLNSPPRTSGLRRELNHNHWPDRRLHHARIHQAQFRFAVARQSRCRKQQNHFDAPQSLQHRICRSRRRYSRNSTHCQPTFCATYGANSDCTVASSRESEKYISCILSGSTFLFTFSAGVACAFFTNCAQATFTTSGNGSSPAVYAISSSVNVHSNTFTGSVTSPVSRKTSRSATFKSTHVPGIPNAIAASHPIASYSNSLRRGVAYRARADTIGDAAGATGFNGKYVSRTGWCPFSVRNRSVY